MTSTAQASTPDPACHAYDREAHLLAELLRSSRLSLLYAEPGADKTSVLRLALMPLLGRRNGDQSAPAAVRASGVVVPFLDRRGRSPSRAARRRRELVVYCSEWGESPVAALRASIERAVTPDRTATTERPARLGEMLEHLSPRVDASFIVLLDRFEDVLRGPAPRSSVAQLVDELAEAVQDPQLPANFLIAVADDAAPGLAGLRARIPGFDDFSLRLATPKGFDPGATSARTSEAPPTAIDLLPILTETLIVSDGEPAPPPRSDLASKAPEPKKKVKRTAPPRVPVVVADVYAMIETELSRIALHTAAEARPQQTGSDRARPAESVGRPAEIASRSLQQAIERMERRLGLPPGDEHGRSR